MGIELLIVVAIIGILAAIAVPNFLNAQIRAKVAQSVSNMKAISTALEMYYIDNNTYTWWATDSNNWQGLWQLTTPISYISGESAFRNPFIKSKAISGNSSVFGTEIDQFIELTTFFKTSNGSFAHQYPNNIYLVESSGPDQGDDYEHQYPQRARVYQPSNGLTSRGDIFLGGGVFIAEWVPTSY